MRNILITGGAGYLGSVFVKNIMAQDWDKVTVVDTLKFGQTPLTEYCCKDNFNFILGDVTDQELMLPLIQEADVIVPFAAIVGFPACDADRDGATKINYKHVKFICDNKNKDTKVIYPNSNSGYGVGEKDVFCTEETPLNPISHYGVTKCLAEKEVIRVGGVVFRLATVFGVSPRMRIDLLVNDFTYKAYNDGYIVLFEHEFKRNYIHVQDVTNAFLHGIENYESMGGELYNVGLSDANLNKKQLCEIIKEQVPNFSINFDDINTDPDKRDYIVSNEKLEATGWAPKVSLADGVKELLKAYPILGRQLRAYTNI
jgi:nucleoside-diphosphate-sugar epimerase